MYEWYGAVVVEASHGGHKLIFLSSSQLNVMTFLFVLRCRITEINPQTVCARNAVFFSSFLSFIMMDLDTWQGNGQKTTSIVLD